MNNILLISKKEFRQVIRDPRTLGVLLFIPLFLLLMFGYAISLDVKHIKLAAVDYDRSSLSRSLLQKFIATEYFDWMGYITGLNEADYLIENETVQCVVVFPRGYSRSIGRAETATLQILIDGTNSNIGATAMGYVQRVVQDASIELITERSAAALQAEQQAVSGRSAGVRTTSAQSAGRIDFRPRVWFNPELRSPVYLIPGLIALILVVTAVISTAMSIVREKEHGTMEQLIVAPIHPVQLVIGKTIPYTVLSVLIALIVLMAGSYFFDIRIQGSIWALLLVTFIFLLSCLSLGLLISTIADSQQVAFMLATIITLLPTFILSGFIFPIRNMPLFVQVFTYIIPARYYLAALRGIMLKGAPLHVFWFETGALILFTLLMLAVSAVRMKKGGLI